MDKVIAVIYDILQSNLKKADIQHIIGRAGEDEFVAIFFVDKDIDLTIDALINANKSGRNAFYFI